MNFDLNRKLIELVNLVRRRFIGCKDLDYR